MWRLLSLSAISVLVAACSDDASCGPGSAAATFEVSNGSDVMLTYGGLTSSAAHDCNSTGVTSLTINAFQTDTQSTVTFCIPAPDMLAKTPGQFGTDVKVIDFNGMANNCTLTLDSLAPPSGTVTADGMCDNGTNKAGYALAFNAHLVLNRMCATSNDTVPVTLSGTVAVSAMP
jgi:hypothetical protein